MKYNKNPIWTIEEIQQLFQSDINKEDIFHNNNQPLYHQLIYLLNRGYLTYEIIETENFLYQYSLQTNQDIETNFKLKIKEYFSQESTGQFVNELIDSMFFSIDAQTIAKIGNVDLQNMLTYFEQGFNRLIIMKSGCKDKLLHIVHATNKYREYVSQQQKQLQLEETLFSSIIEPTSGYEMQPSVLHKESIENGDLIEFEWNGENLRGCVIDTNIDNLERYIKLTKFDLRFMKQQRLLQNPLLEEKQINIIAQYELFKETEDILNIPNLVIRRFIEINNGAFLLEEFSGT